MEDMALLPKASVHPLDGAPECFPCVESFAKAKMIPHAGEG
jgi:hypothetical protein